MTYNLAPAQAGTMAPSLASEPSVDFITDEASWENLVAHAPLPHLPQSFAYGEGKRAKGWTIRRALFRQDKRPLAFATVLERRVAGVRILTRINRGPVFLDSKPAASEVQGIYAALRRRWRGPLLIAPALPSGGESRTLLRAAGFRMRQEAGWLSGRIDLRPSEDAIFAGYSSAFRNRVRHSEKAGGEVEISTTDDAYEWLLERHAENMRDKHFNAADATLLRAMRAAAPENVLIFRLLHEGRPVAGMSVVRFGKCAEYHIGWFGPEGRKLNAGNLMMWTIQQELKRLGVVAFDVGGMKPGDGYTRFKRTMNPVEFTLAGEWMSF